MSEKDKADASPDDVVETTRHRSPNYPMFGLPKAIERAEEIFSKWKRSLVPVNLVHSLWSYKEHSNQGNRAISTLKSFGLIDVEGEQKSRRVRLTEQGIRILMKSPDRESLLKKAVLGPAIYSEIWDKYKGEENFPDDELLRHYLLWDRPEPRFNDDVVNAFIQNFRESLRYAGMNINDILTEDVDAKDIPLLDRPLSSRPHLGAFVQVEDGPGKYKYDKPRKVVGVDGEWVFIEGESAGIQEDRVFVMKNTTESKMAAKMPPPNPYLEVGSPATAMATAATTATKNDQEEVKWEVQPLRFPLSRGNVIEIRLKSPVSKKEFDRIKQLIELSEPSFLMDEEANQED